MFLSKDVEEKAIEIAHWLRENANPHTTIEITDSGIKVKSDESFVPVGYLTREPS